MKVVRANDAPAMENVYESRAWERHARATEAQRAHRSASDARRPALTNRIPPDDAGSVFVSPLTGQSMPMSQFTHNNMVPFYRGAVKQSVRPDAFNSRLEAFTGVDSVGGPVGVKEEANAFFIPQRNDAGLKQSADDLRVAYLSSMQPSRNRTHEQPMSMLVGKPGVAGGATGDVYYDQRQYAYTPNVDQLRPLSRPKLTFEGRLNPGEAMTAARPALPQIVKQQTRMPFKEQTSANDFFRTTGAYTAQTSRPDFVVQDTARQTTSANYYVGPGAPANTFGPSQQASAAASAPHRVHLQGGRVGPAAPSTQTRAGDYGKAGVVAYPNERDTTATRTVPGLVTSAIKAIVQPFADIFKPTRKEEMVGASREFGNIGVGGIPVQPKLTIYDANDVARTTLKQTGIVEAPLANLRGNHKPGAAYDPEEYRARTSLKETTLAEAAVVNLYGANVRHVLPVHDPDAVARTTLKETTLRDGTWDGRLGGDAPGIGRRAYVRDPCLDLKVTTRDTLDRVETNVNPAVSRAAGKIVDPEAWRTSATMREMTARFGHTDGSEGAIGGLQNLGRQGAYTTTANDIRYTQRQALEASGVTYGAAQRPQGTEAGGYIVAPTDVKDTQRQTLSDSDYYGTASSAAKGGAPTSQQMDRSMNSRSDRDFIAANLDARGPTTEGPKAGTAIDQLGATASPDPQRTTVQYDAGDFVASRPMQFTAATLGVVEQDKMVSAELTGAQSDDRLLQDLQSAAIQRNANAVAQPAFGGGGGGGGASPEPL